MAKEAFDKANALREQIKAADPKNEDELEQFRIQFLGSKNQIKPLFGMIGSLPNEKKKEFGQLVNSLKQEAEEKYERIQQNLQSQAEEKEGDALDLSAPSYPYRQGSRHPITITLNRIIDIFRRIGFDVVEDREIEDQWHNFTALNTPEDHPARDMQDTFYLKDDHEYVLRTHTSSVQARLMENTQPPIRIIAPGRVYRNETVSARSHCQFHQVEGLYVDEGVSMADMKQALLYFARAMYGPETKIRLRPSYFPFTEPSAEMDVYWGLNSELDHKITKGTGWLEVLGCGMVDPNVLDACGIDPEKYTGYAFGMGIERQAMRSHKISDIRLLFENDIRFLEQFKGAL
jgi:phenylalanyl-tRNA synthetase alpha chain